MHKIIDLVKFVIDKQLEDAADSGFILTKALVVEKVNVISTNPLIEDRDIDFEEIHSELFLYYDYELRKASISVDAGESIVSEEDHQPWDIPRNEFYWNTHKKYLLEKFGSLKPTIATEIVKSIDNESDSILSMLEDPFRDSFSSTKFGKSL